MAAPSMAAPSVAMDRYFKGRDAEEPSVKAIADFFNAPLVKDIPRGMLKVQTPGAQVNTAPFRALWGFGLLVLLDLAMHAGAGAAAVSVGAKGNGLPVTTRALQLGALAAITKAGMTTFREAVLKGHVNFAFSVLLFVLTSSFGICPLLVTEVGNLALGEAPKELLIAAVVAAVPLFFDTIRDIEPKPDDEGKIDYFRWAWAIFLIPTDALGGYVFARMAANQGVPISNFPAACSAGAVFGTLTFLSRAMTGCIAMIHFTTAKGSTSTIFGVWEFIVPEPVIMSQEDYQKLEQGVTGAVTNVFTMGPKMAMKPFKLVARLVSCCCPCWPLNLKAGVEDMEHSFDRMQAEMPSDMMAMGALFLAEASMGRVVAIGDGDPTSSQGGSPGRISEGSHVEVPSQVGVTSPAEPSDQVSGHHPGQSPTAPLAPPQPTATAPSEQTFGIHLAAQIGGSGAK